MFDLESRRRGEGAGEGGSIHSPTPSNLLIFTRHSPPGCNFFSPQPCAAVKSNMAAKSFAKIIPSTRPLCRLIIADYYGSPLVYVNLTFTKHRNATSCHEKRKMPVLNITIASFLDAAQTHYCQSAALDVL